MKIVLNSKKFKCDSFQEKLENGVLFLSLQESILTDTDIKEGKILAIAKTYTETKDNFMWECDLLETPVALELVRLMDMQIPLEIYPKIIDNELKHLCVRCKR